MAKSAYIIKRINIFISFLPTHQLFFVLIYENDKKEKRHFTLEAKKSKLVNGAHD